MATSIGGVWISNKLWHLILTNRLGNSYNLESSLNYLDQLRIWKFYWYVFLKNQNPTKALKNNKINKDFYLTMI